ncbi:MAG: hypothetical protein JNK05_08935 [Myxococcales bacterium]|nr:hypothetical protein [Myxococcales bacterium]
MRGSWSLALLFACVGACARGGVRGIEALAPCPDGARVEESSDVHARVTRCVRGDGVAHGPWRMVEGSTVTYGQYSDGFAQGRFSQRTLDGTEIGSYELRDGSGEIIHRYPSGKIEWRGALDHGRPLGLRRYFREDGITTMIERAGDGRVLETIGRHFPSEIDEYDACDDGVFGDHVDDECPERRCEVRGSEVSLRAASVRIGANTEAFDIERYRVAWAPSASERGSVNIEAPLRFRATVPAAQLVARLRAPKIFAEGGAYARAAAGRAVTLVTSENPAQTQVDLGDGLALRSAHVRCSELTLEGRPNPNALLEAIPAVGTALRSRSATLALASAPNGRAVVQLAVDSTARFARVSSQGEWLQIAWQRWDWSAVSGWVRASAMESATHQLPPDRSDAHAITDRDDCARSADERAVRLVVGARVTAAPNGEAWAEVTSEVAATVRNAEANWLQIVSIAGLSYASDSGGCRRLERAFVTSDGAR